MHTHFLSCDWGTSSFRLKVVDSQTAQTVASLEHAIGIKQTFDEWQQYQTDRLTFFQTRLQEGVQELSQKFGIDCSDLKIVLSGMASSSIGMQELPYGMLPLSLNGETLVTQNFSPNPHCSHEIILVSGIRKAGDVMRGEEVQLIGWSRTDNYNENCVVILPGTHSKHCWIENGQLVDFQTYMTGELYEIISTHSILKNSIRPSGQWDTAAQAAFTEGVAAIGSGNLTNLLFTIRGRQLENSLNSVESGYFLSGLLIGQEIKALAGTALPVVLCGAAKFHPLYLIAAEQIGVKHFSALAPDTVENLVVLGQTTIFEQATYN